jgi:hypothetical protein
MKKITILAMAVFTFIVGFGQSQVSSLGINNPIIFQGSTQTSLAPCTEVNPNDGTFEEGFNCSSASSFKAANDLKVNADENFTLNQITASIFANNGIASVDVKYYDDASGLPGSLIGSEFGLTPSSQNVIGINYGFDVNEIVVDVSPIVFLGQPFVTTKYWIELIVTDGGSTPNVFWVATSSTAIGEPIAQYDTFWGFPNPIFDGVYIWAGECDTILSVGESIGDLVGVYPNPAKDQLFVRIPSGIEIQRVKLYDVLGNNTGIKLINGSMDISQLARGVYLLSVETSKGTINKKVIKR